MFAGGACCTVSVLCGPTAPDGSEFSLALAAGLARQAYRVWLVECADGNRISHLLGCLPLLSWRAGLPLQQQVIDAGMCGLVYAPGAMAGDAALENAAAESRRCDFLLFDGGRFSLGEAPVDAAASQTLVLLLGKADAEAGYALLKALKTKQSPARVLLLGEVAEVLAQSVSRFMGWVPESRQTEIVLCQIGNRQPETSSNTLTIASNLAWVVSKITQNDQPKVAHGGCGEGAEEIFER